MALINNIYVFVSDESVSRTTNVPQHPVEKGLPLTDSIRNEARELSISGKIVNTKNKTADNILSEIDKLRKNGSLITYKGRNIIGNFMIKSFNTTHPNTNWGGADFNMNLVEVRIAKSAYNPSKQGSSQKTLVKKTPTLAVGATVVFQGGPVYVSSDAIIAAANRGKQTCKITKISTKSWSIHPYHLISVDKVYPNNVYGWVDLASIIGIGATDTKAEEPKPKPKPATPQPTPDTNKKDDTKDKKPTTNPAPATNTSPTTNAGTQQKQPAKTDYTRSKKDNEEPYAPAKMEKVGTLKEKMVVGSEAFFNKNVSTVDGVSYYISSGTYYPTSHAKTTRQREGKVKYFPAGTPYYRRYAKVGR